MRLTAHADKIPRLSSAARFRLLRAFVYFIGLAPAVWTFYLGLTNQLGANPIRTLEQDLGIWALRFLIATLTVTPAALSVSPAEATTITVALSRSTFRFVSADNSPNRSDV